MNRFLTTSVLLVLAASSAFAGEGIPKKVLDKIANHQLMSSCWGEDNVFKYYKMVKDACDECMQLTPAFDLDLFESANPNFGLSSGFQTLPESLPNNFLRPNGNGQQANFDRFLAFMWRQFQDQQGNSRLRRAIEKPSEQDMAEFADSVVTFKMSMKDNVGNLTCILAKMGALDGDLNIRLEHFTQDVWQMMPGVDPVLKNKVTEGMRDCYAISQAIPQDILEKKPITNQFGRQMFFFKCCHKMETKLCAQKEMARWIDIWYGKPTSAMRSRLGLPSDPYEAAAVTFKVMESSKTDSEKFVNEFFFGGQDH